MAATATMLPTAIEARQGKLRLLFFAFLFVTCSHKQERRLEIKPEAPSNESAESAPLFPDEIAPAFPESATPESSAEHGDLPDGIACALDAECNSGFCDRDTCASPDATYSFGSICQSPLIGRAGTVVSKTDFCPYVCVDSRCRSCSSGKECYELEGLTTCEPSGGGRPGSRCVAVATEAAADEYTPPVPSPSTGILLDGQVGSTCSVPALKISAAPVDASWQRPRLAVVWWHQRVGIADEFMQIAYDIAWAGEALSISIGQINTPWEQNLICLRNCPARDTCSCAETPAVALGTVVIAQDQDGDGALELEELRSEQVGGMSDVLLGWSAAAADSVPLIWSDWFRDIALGPCIYEVIASGTPLLRPLEDKNRAFALHQCPSADTSCSFPVPELVCSAANCDLDRGLNRFGF